MSPIYFTFVLLLCLVVLCPAPATAQDAPAADRTGALRVFLDCAQCDENYLRTEITFINYVRDRADADVHVLVTTQPTGGGGLEYTIKFIGLGRFAGVDQTLPYVSAQTDTEDQRRIGFAASVPSRADSLCGGNAACLAPEGDLRRAEGHAAAATVADPWNFWVFRVGASGNLEGQESENENQVSASLSANRTTEAWKLNFEAEGEYGEEEFVLDEGEIFTSISRNIEADALVGKSVTQHWSLGIVGALESSIFSNYDVRTRIAPAVEYDVFPYSQSTRRLLTMLYTIGVEAADYMEVTIYDKTSETLPDHRFETTLELRQPWGSASASFEAAQYLSQPDKYRLSTFGGVELRLFKGLSIEFFGEASRRRDQLSLRRGDATNEEILVRQRELATGYEYEFSFGISYSFGSIFNNVVNPRFRNAGGF